MLLELGWIRGEAGEMERSGHGGPGALTQECDPYSAWKGPCLKHRVRQPDFCLAAAWSMDLKNRGHFITDKKYQISMMHA